jgi:acetyl-CoA synthetase
VSVEPQSQGGPEIENLLAETRTFPPDPAFVAQANATAELYEAAAADTSGFWAQARERINWYTPFDTTLDWDLPFARWFVGGELNITSRFGDGGHMAPDRDAWWHAQVPDVRP